MEIENQPARSNSGLGAQFRTAREAKNISLEQVESELCILKRHIEAIERDDFDSLPQMAFTRGFVTSYAKFLKLDVNNIITRFEAIYPAASPASVAQITTEVAPDKTLGKVSRNDNKKASFGRLGLILVPIALIAFGLIYFMTSQKRDAQTKQNNAAPTVLEEMQQADGVFNPTTNEDSNLNNSSADKTNTADIKTKTTDAAATNTSALNNANANNANDSSANANNAQAAQTTANIDPNAKPAQLVFWVIRATNIDIKDQKGTVLMSGVKSRGEHKVSGIPPFNIQIANTANVRLNMDKSPIKLKKYSIDNKADFTLTK